MEVFVSIFYEHYWIDILSAKYREEVKELLPEDYQKFGRSWFTETNTAQVLAAKFLVNSDVNKSEIADIALQYTWETQAQALGILLEKQGASIEKSVDDSLQFKASRAPLKALKAGADAELALRFRNVFGITAQEYALDLELDPEIAIKICRPYIADMIKCGMDVEEAMKLPCGEFFSPMEAGGPVSSRKKDLMARHCKTTQEDEEAQDLGEVDSYVYGEVIPAEQLP